MATYKQKEDANNPSLPSAAYQYMSPKWAMISALLGGTSAMRDAGEDYLPMHSAEDQGDYDNRLSQSVLYNVTELTLNSLVGRVFREPLTYSNGDGALETFAENVDSNKTNLNSFAQNWFGKSMAKGFSHVLIDMPALYVDPNVPRTLADDKKENRRPFWSLIDPENVIFMYWERINGVDTLLQARIVEYEVSLDGFTEVCETRIRILTPGKWELWHDVNENKPGNRKPKWEKFEEGNYDLPIIPLVTFYTDKEGCAMQCKPPLEDLAYINIRHWQSNSDQINVLTVARFPMLAASGAQQEAGKSSMPIGPRQLLSMRDPNGRFYYVEHTGRAISSGKEDLEMLEDRMAAYGAEFLRRQISGRTAFERAADANEAVSPLKAMATRFETAIEAALGITAMWLKLDESKVGDITINKTYTQEEDKSDPMTVLGEARNRGDLSWETWLNEAKDRKNVNELVDTEEERARIKQERVDGFTVDPAQPYSTKVRQTSGEIDSGATKSSTDANTETPPPPKPGAKPVK